MRPVDFGSRSLVGRLSRAKELSAQRAGKARIAFVALFCFSLASAVVCAQTGAGVYPKPQILEVARRLQMQLTDPAKASEGIVEERLDEVTQVAVRNKSGRGELHQKADDIFFVIAGQATLVSGGTMTNPKGDQEVRGDSVVGGTSILLHQGDVVHISHSVPHQLLIKQGESFTYVVVKIPH
jgi:mannose-6-phosphate isomerase-like protein (cupin superfamily)